MDSLDDPYRLLADSVVTKFSPAEVGRMLVDKLYIYNAMKHEVQGGLDINGPFSDCVITEAISEDLVGWKHDVEAFAKSLYLRLDKPRFQQALRESCEEFGIEPVFPISSKNSL